MHWKKTEPNHQAGTKMMSESQKEMWEARGERVKFLKRIGYDSAWLSHASDSEVTKAYWKEQSDKD